MKQPIPDVNETDVIRIVRRDFSAEQFGAVMSILNDYGRQDRQRDVYRVRLAALKLAAGDLEALHRQIDVAKTDYRDVLASAEYPEYMQKAPPSAELDREEKKRIIRSDWTQYQLWLNRP